MNIEKELWENMRQTAATFSMPMATHQQLQQLFNQIEQMAAQKAQQPAPDFNKPNGEARVAN